jgi:HK97 family phage major capsid protein
MSKINELMDQVAAKRAELKSVFDANEDGKYTSEQKEEIKSRNDELATLVEDLNIEKKKASNEKALADDSKPVAEMPLASGSEAEVKTVGEQFVQTDAYKNYMDGGVKGVDSHIETKTTLTTTGYPPEVLRTPGILETALRDPNAVISLFDVINTDQNAFSYLEETTFTNNAAEAAEGSAVGEAALAFTEQTEAIRKMGIFIPVTDELLADESGIQGYINSRLQTMIRLRLDNQLLNGDGTAPNLEGILDAGKASVGSTDYSSYAGTLGKIGALYGAITDIRVNAFTEPDAIVMHPSDWNDVVTSVGADFAGTSSAGYAEKSPLFVAAGGMGAGPSAQIWGLKVVPTTAIAAGTVLVGKFGGGEAANLVMRQGMELAVSDSHSDFFIKNQLAIRATMRVGFPVYREAAFHKITNF